MDIYLYLKQCSHCNLKYFGKTVSDNPANYKGSGTDWLEHLKEHKAKQVTKSMWRFKDHEACRYFALSFSADNNIVESDEWANKQVESGGLSGRQFIPISERISASERMKRDNPMKLLRTNKGTFKKGHKPKITVERNEKVRLSKLGDKNPNFANSEFGYSVQKIKKPCEHCGIVTNLGNYARWHGPKCRLT